MPNPSAANAAFPDLEDSQDEAEERELHAKMADLLRRYPRIGTEEAAELLRFLTATPAMAVERMVEPRGLQPNLLRFRQEHPTHFRMTIGQRLAMTALAAMPALGVIYLALHNGG